MRYAVPMGSRLPARFALLVLALTCDPPPARGADTEDAVRAITAQLRARHFQEALDLARVAEKSAPKEVRILVLEGMALTGLRQDGQALTVFERAIAISPDYIPALEAAVEIEYRTGSPNAQAHLERLLTLRPGEPTAHAMMGALAWKREDCAAAVEHYGQATAAIASQPDALREYGICLARVKRADDAAKVFGQLAVLRPEDKRARYAWAVSLIDAARYRNAIGVLEPLAGGSAPDPIALELTSSAFESMGQTPRAVAALRQAVLLDPRNVELYLDFAALSFTHQSFQVGIDMINAGLTQAGDSAAMYLARGVLYVQLAEYAKADADFDRAERLDPIQGLGSAARGLSMIQQNNLDEALVTVRERLKTNPKDEFQHYLLAELLSRQGVQAGTPEFQQAIDSAREAVRLKPDFPLARDVLSRLYLQSGETGKAIEQCRLALRDDPSDEMALYRLIRALQSAGGDAAQEVPALLKRFTALREEARRRQSQETQYRLVEAK